MILEAIEGVFACIQLMFEKPLLLLGIIAAGAIYVLFIHADEKPIKHQRAKSGMVARFIKGGIEAVKEKK